METSQSQPPIKLTRVEWLQYILFWSWNLIFLAFMSFGFAPIVLPETFVAVRTGSIPATFLLYGLVLASIPVIVIILGLTVLRRSPDRLFALGYVIEGPLMLMLAVRFFLIRQATPGTLLLMLIALSGMAAFLWYLLDQYRGRRRSGVEFLRLAGLTMMALTSLYAAIWIAFYAIPLGVEILRSLGYFISHLPRILVDLWQGLGQIISDTPLMLPFSLLGFILLGYTATLIVLTPIVVPYLSFRAWWRTLEALKDRLGWVRPAVVVSVMVLVCAGMFYLVNQQPQQHAFALLETPPATPAEAQSLLQKSDSIRSGLLNAYLAPFRYISAEGEVNHVSDIYANSIKLPRQQAFAVQRLYESVASPLLYKPVKRPDVKNLVDNQALVNEPQQAARLYQRFFDTPITQGERQTIVRSVRSTWSANQAEAAWQAVDDREVRLLRQELTLTEHGDWADVDLQEVYQNQTTDQQEVIYYFNLPESAVLTGVWLGDNPDKETAYNFQVAPRGAAQAVYREQVRRSIDPALLEQIGPRQYRLRVYPIPPMRTTYDQRRSRTLVEEAQPLYLWLSWREMAEGDSWPMAKLAFLRNVYWDNGTERLVNGQPMRAEANAWLPASLPVAGENQAQAHRVDLAGGKTVLAIPSGQAVLPDLPEKLRIGVVLDRSYSMQAHAAEVASTLDQLKSLTNLDTPVDVYLTASPYRGAPPSIKTLNELSEQDLVYYGGQNAAQLLAQYDTLRKAERSNQQYDALLVLTDGSGYELGASEAQPVESSAPIWIVHAGADIPLGYDDQTLQAIQASGGGVASSLDEALERIAVHHSALGLQQSADLVDGYLWSVLPTSEVDQAIPVGVKSIAHQPDEPFAALAARRLILAEIQRNRGTINQLDTLDALHALALKYQIVSPYSSMIVLINEQQQNLLDNLTEGEDRYQREVEALAETTPGSRLPLTGVPEPHEWLLLGLAVAMLVWLAFRRQKLAVRF